MRPLRRRTPMEKAVKAVRDVNLPALNDIQAPKGVKTGVTAVLAATATSAVISAVRRRVEGTGDR